MTLNLIKLKNKQTRKQLTHAIIHRKRKANRLSHLGANAGATHRQVWDPLEVQYVSSRNGNHHAFYDVQ